jgi:aryl-alcohol dehydrogenase-like predicted oxidoreductase
MERRRLGQSGLWVSRVGLGTMAWGQDTDAHEAADMLRVYLDAGGSLVDTAAAYGEGDSERVVGSLIGKVVDREDLVLATKGGIVRHDGVRTVDTSRGALLDQLDGSLERLGTDHVDLWQVHTWSWDSPLDETLTALDFAVSTGRTRYVGISNYTGWQTAQAATWQAAVPGRAAVSSTQVEYSLLERGVEREVLPAAMELGLGVLAWSPLGRGVLTGKYRTGTPADSRGASPHFAGFVDKYLTPDAARVVTAVCTAAEGLDLTPLEVALAWVRDRPGVTSVLLGSRTAPQLAGALAADDVVLPDEIRAALDEVSRPSGGYPERGRDQR